MSNDFHPVQTYSQICMLKTWQWCRLNNLSILKIPDDAFKRCNDSVANPTARWTSCSPKRLSRVDSAKWRFHRPVLKVLLIRFDHRFRIFLQMNVHNCSHISMARYGLHGVYIILEPVSLALPALCTEQNRRIQDQSDLDFSVNGRGERISKWVPTSNISSVRIGDVSTSVSYYLLWWGI